MHERVSINKQNEAEQTKHDIYYLMDKYISAVKS